MPVTDFPDYAKGFADELVTGLDPLKADRACAAVPELNRREDVPALVAELRAILPGRPELDAFTPYERLAAMRDLGLFLSSIRRHGDEPLDAVPEAEPVLLELAERTAMVPRETMLHYTCWNPRDSRQRMYTGDPQETGFIDSVRMVLRPIGAAIEVCGDLVTGRPADPWFADALGELEGHLQSTVDSIDLVMRDVTPEFFSQGLRPFFDPVRVAGTDYMAPAAAHVPLALVDLVLWAGEQQDEDYAGFQQDLVPYTPPHWRQRFEDWAEVPSVVGKLTTAVRHSWDAAVEARTLAGVRALRDVLRVLVTFRGRHLTNARRAYQAELTEAAVGSGGAGLDLLADVLALTRENATLAKNPHRAAA